MKNLLLVVCLLLGSCGVVGPGLFIEVENELDFARNGEVVEIDWEQLQGAAITPEKVVVFDNNDNQVPSQVIFDNEGNPTHLLFTASVEANSSSVYNIRRKVREEYPPQAYGRYVPERMDDYAWENNLTAYRIYGPRLKDPLSQGVDVWVKNTPKMIIDEWFARGNYHHNYGEGMDCYKVGNTLGGGALAVVDGGELLLSGNYTKQLCTANGPIRTKAEFEYAPINVAGKSVIMHRTIWLDANSRFTCQEYCLEGFEGNIEVAAGIVLHDVKAQSNGKDYVAITEPASDSKEPERDGDISLAVILQGGESSSEMDYHAVTLRKVQAGETIRMWNGSAWSQSGVKSHEEWQTEVEQMRQRIASPLTAKFIKRREAKGIQN